MIEGADNLDISSCASQKPISGFNPSRGLHAGAQPELRPGHRQHRVPAEQPRPVRDHGQHQPRQHLRPDRARRARELVRDAAGRGGAALPAGRRHPRPPARQRGRPHLVRLHEPDHAAVRRRPRAQGDEPRDGPRGHPARAGAARWPGSTPTHTLPESLLASSPTTTPYQQPPFAGDVEAAKAEMAQSKYDTDKDGTCDAPACKGVVQPQPQLRALVVDVADHRAVGGADRHHHRDPRGLALGRERRLEHHRRARSRSARATAGARTTPTRSTFFAIYDGRNIIPSGNTAFALVGVTKAQEGELGVTVPAGGVPSINADIDKCVPLTDQERTDCWIALDKKLTEEIVPQVGLMDATDVDADRAGGDAVRLRPVRPRSRRWRASRSTRPCRTERRSTDLTDGAGRGGDAPARRRTFTRHDPLHHQTPHLRRDLVILAVTLVAFVIFFVLPSTDPAVAFAGRNPTPELIAEVEEQLGLDEPVPGAVRALRQAPRSPATSTAGPASGSRTTPARRCSTRSSTARIGDPPARHRRRHTLARDRRPDRRDLGAQAPHRRRPRRDGLRPRGRLHAGLPARAWWRSSSSGRSSAGCRAPATCRSSTTRSTGSCT